MDFGVLLIILGTVVVLAGAGVLRSPSGGGGMQIVRDVMAKNEGLPIRSVEARPDGSVGLSYAVSDVQPQRSNPLEDILGGYEGGNGPGPGHPG